MKVFLLETDEIVKEQISNYIQKNYKIELKIFSDSRQLIKASVSHYPDMIIFGINENSKNLFAKLASFRNSFNTKLIVIISVGEKKEHYPLEIAHHILYKPFTTQDLDYCLVNYLGVKENLTDNEIQQDEIQQLDILEVDNFNFDLKKNFELSNRVTIEDVKNELYDDVSILESDLEQPLQIKNISDNLYQNKFNPEILFQNKDEQITPEKSQEILKDYFQKIKSKFLQIKLDKKAPHTGSEQITFREKKEQKINSEFSQIKLDKKTPHTGSEQITFREKKEQRISSIDLSNIKKEKEKLEDDILSITDFNVKFLD